MNRNTLIVLFLLMVSVFGVQSSYAGPGNLIGYEIVNQDGLKEQIPTDEEIFNTTEEVILFIEDSAESSTTVSALYLPTGNTFFSKNLNPLEAQNFNFNERSYNGYVVPIPVVSEGQYQVNISGVKYSFFNLKQSPQVMLSIGDGEVVNDLKDIKVSSSTISNACPPSERWSKEEATCQFRELLPLDGCQQGYALKNGSCHPIVARKDICPDGFNDNGSGQCIGGNSTPVKTECNGVITERSDGVCYGSPYRSYSGEGWPRCGGSPGAGYSAVVDPDECLWTNHDTGHQVQGFFYVDCPAGSWDPNDRVGYCTVNVTPEYQGTKVCSAGVKVGNVCLEVSPYVSEGECPENSLELNTQQCYATYKEAGKGTCNYGDLVGEQCLKVSNVVPLIVPRVTSVKAVFSHQSSSAPVTLNLQKVSDAEYGIADKLDLFSSDGDNWNLFVSAIDASGNLSSKSVTFNYSPELAKINGQTKEFISLPTTSQNFSISTSTLKTGIAGSDDVFAFVSADSIVGVNVNGVIVEPGQKKVVSQNVPLGLSDGKLNVTLSSIGNQTEGTARLMLGIGADSMNVETKVMVSTPSVEVDVPSSVTKYVDLFEIKVKETGSCQIVSDESRAYQSNYIFDPICLVEVESNDITIGNYDSGVGGYKARTLKEGTVGLSYNLYLVNPDKSKTKIGSGSKTINSVTALSSSLFQISSDGEEFFQEISDTKLPLKLKEGKRCYLTTNQELAKEQSKKALYLSRDNYCYLEWLLVPKGMSQDPTYEEPMLSGKFTDVGENTFHWRAVVFDMEGKEVVIADESQTISVLPPEPPKISLTSTAHFQDDIYLVSTEPGYLGDVEIEAKEADIDLRIHRGSDVLVDEAVRPFWYRKNKVYRRLETDKRPLWSETQYDISASYQRLPQIETKKQIKTVVVPNDSIKPVISIEQPEAVSTEVFPVKVTIKNQYRPDDGYDESTMGKWLIRLVRKSAYNESEPLTEYQPALNGEVSFDLDISNIDSTSLRIVAEAQLVSELDGYQRITESNSPAFVSVLRGNEVKAEVKARSISGRAPFTTVFKLNVLDRLDYRSVGNVTWQVSQNGGGAWQKKEVEERKKYQLVDTFDKGNYLVRAIIENKYSGKTFQTETVKVIAYNQPTIDVVGPTTLFVGSKGRFEAIVNSEDGLTQLSGNVVEWSVDGGGTYPYKGESLEIMRDTPERIKLWVRVRDLDAPEDDIDAYEVQKLAVEFKDVKAPRVYVTGPRLIETNETYSYKADIGLPYRGMEVEVLGYFTLPDGRIVYGNTVDYTPSEDDLTKSTVDVTYTAWIDGYKDTGSLSTYSLRSRVWQYVWPSFGMQVRKSADVAPATITASVRPIAFNGKLEEPTYEWELPEGAVIQDQRQDVVRSFVINEPGDYNIKVTVRDARGHEAVIEQPLKIGQAEPYAIDLQYSGSNKYEREPLDVLLRPYISGGHPRDRISTRVYSVDGTPLESSGYYGRATLGAGEHSIKLKITSEMGHEAEGEVNINVAENKLPACSLSSRETVGSWIVYANCEDTDGRMKSYEWTIAGELQSISSDRVTISKGTYETMPTISLVGVDDSGGKSEAVTMN